MQTDYKAEPCSWSYNKVKEALSVKCNLFAISTVNKVSIKSPDLFYVQNKRPNLSVKSCALKKTTTCTCRRPRHPTRRWNLNKQRCSRENCAARHGRTEQNQGALAKALVLLFPDSSYVHPQTHLYYCLIGIPQLASTLRRCETSAQAASISEFRSKQTDWRRAYCRNGCFSSWSDPRKCATKKPWRPFFVDWSSAECRRIHVHWQTAGRVGTPRLYHQLNTLTR